MLEIRNVLIGLVLALLLAACGSGSSTTSSTMFARPTGIYVLPTTNEGPGSSASAVALVSQPFVDGWVLRLAWKDIEVSGTYNWLRIDNALAALGSAVPAKKLTLSIFAMEVPSDVLAQSGVMTYAADTPTGQVTTAVPWDETALLRWEVFCLALSNHSVSDVSAGTTVALRDHPLLAQLDTQIMGLGGLRDLNGKLVATNGVAGGYTRAAFTSATVRSIHAMVDNFPNKFHYFAFFNMIDKVASPPLYQDMLDTLMTEFNAGATPKLGLFQENLGCSTPNTTTTSPSAWGLYTSRDRTFSMFQMIHSWVVSSAAPEIKDCINKPGTAIGYAYNTFGTRYFEVYRTDLEYADYAPYFTSWHNTLFP